MLAWLLVHASPEQVNARNILGCTPATYAAFLSQDEALQLLIKHGAHIDIADNAQHSAHYWTEQLICPTPIPFISVTQVSMTTEARVLLQSLTEKELVVVGIVGKYRSGKSFIFLVGYAGTDCSSCHQSCITQYITCPAPYRSGTVSAECTLTGSFSPAFENVCPPGCRCDQKNWCIGCDDFGLQFVYSNPTDIFSGRCRLNEECHSCDRFAPLNTDMRNE